MGFFVKSIKNKLNLKRMSALSPDFSPFLRRLITFSSINACAEYTAHQMLRIACVERCSFLYRENATDNFDNLVTAGCPQPLETVSQRSEIVKYFETASAKFAGALTASELENNIKAKLEMKRLQIHGVLPIYIGKELLALLFFGKGFNKKMERCFYDKEISCKIQRELGVNVSRIKNMNHLINLKMAELQQKAEEDRKEIKQKFADLIIDPLGIAKGRCETLILDIEDDMLRHMDKQEILNRTISVMKDVIRQTDRISAKAKEIMTHD